MELPLIGSIANKTLGLDLLSVQPMSEEQRANGRITLPFPYRYHSFRSFDDLKAYIVMQLTLKKNELQPEWLKVSLENYLPFNLSKSILYTQVQVIGITCYEPAKHIQDDIRHGEHMCDLDPEAWDIEKVKDAIEEVKLSFI